MCLFLPLSTVFFLQGLSSYFLCRFHVKGHDLEDLYGVLEKRAHSELDPFVEAVRAAGPELPGIGDSRELQLEVISCRVKPTGAAVQILMDTKLLRQAGVSDVLCPNYFRC